MTFCELYFRYNDWEMSTMLKINLCMVNKSEELLVSKALVKYAEYEVVGFSSSWVTLLVPDLCA